MYFLQGLPLIGMETTTPRGIAGALDPGPSSRGKRLKPCPPESDRRNENQHFLFVYKHIFPYSKKLYKSYSKN